MKKRDIISGIFWIIIGIGVCWGGLDLELGTLHDPGSGFIFFWVGIIIMALASAIFIKGLKEISPEEDLGTIFSKIKWKKVLAVAGALLAYSVLFSILGFLLTTIFFLIFLFKAIEPQRWSVAISLAIISSLTAYFVFYWWLKVQLPRGVLFFG